MKTLIRAITFATALGVPWGASATQWDVSLWGKPRAFTSHVEKLAELVAARTDGAFTLNLDYGGLSSNRANLDNLSAGQFEMAQFCVGYHPEKTPTLTVMELPFLGIETLSAERRVSEALYKHPAVVEDMARWNATLLMPSPLPQYNLAGVGKPPRAMYELRGVSVRATGGIAAAMEVLGMEPIAMAATDVQGALEADFIRAVAFAPHAHMAFGVADRAAWWTTNLNPGSVHCPVVVNSDALAALTPEHRRVLMAAASDALDHYIQSYTDSAMAAWEETVAVRGITEVSFSDTALQILSEAAQRDAYGPWMVKHRRNGLPAQELLSLVRETAAR